MKTVFTSKRHSGKISRYVLADKKIGIYLNSCGTTLYSFFIDILINVLCLINKICLNK